MLKVTKILCLGYRFIPCSRAKITAKTF